MKLHSLIFLCFFSCSQTGWSLLSAQSSIPKSESVPQKSKKVKIRPFWVAFALGSLFGVYSGVCSALKALKALKDKDRDSCLPSSSSRKNTDSQRQDNGSDASSAHVSQAVSEEALVSSHVKKLKKYIKEAKNSGVEISQLGPLNPLARIKNEVKDNDIFNNVLYEFIQEKFEEMNRISISFFTNPFSTNPFSTNPMSILKDLEFLNLCFKKLKRFRLDIINLFFNNCEEIIFSSDDLQEIRKSKFFFNSMSEKMLFYLLQVNLPCVFVFIIQKAKALDIKEQSWNDFANLFNELRSDNKIKTVLDRLASRFFKNPEASLENKKLLARGLVLSSVDGVPIDYNKLFLDLFGKEFHAQNNGILNWIQEEIKFKSNNPSKNAIFSMLTNAYGIHFKDTSDDKKQNILKNFQSMIDGSKLDASKQNDLKEKFKSSLFSEANHS